MTSIQGRLLESSEVDVVRKDFDGSLVFFVIAVFDLHGHTSALTYRSGSPWSHPDGSRGLDEESTVVAKHILCDLISVPWRL